MTIQEVKAYIENKPGRQFDVTIFPFDLDSPLIETIEIYKGDARLVYSFSLRELQDAPRHIIKRVIDEQILPQFDGIAPPPAQWAEE